MPGNLFLKIKSIPGSSTVKGMENTIEVLSFSWGGSNSANAASGVMAGETKGHAQVTDLQINKTADKASPLLFENMIGGKRMTDDVELFVQKILNGKSETYYTLKLKGAIVSQFSAGGSSNDAPNEAIAFNFSKIEFSYADEEGGKLKGPVTKGWDVATQEKS
jgi:type VI secretion system secreted protein Hcp